MKPFKKLVLPADFAQRILDNEIEFKLAEQPSNEVVCNLIELYSKGVQYYESMKSYKYLYFKKKMEELFTDNTKIFTKEEAGQVKDVKEADSPMKQKLNSKNQQQRKKALQFREKQDKLQQEVIERTKTGATKQEVQKLIQKVEEKERKLQTQLKASLDTQDKALQQKLRERKKKSFCKSFSTFGLTQSTQTKASLFAEESPNIKNVGKANEKGIIEPLFVNFESVIKDDSDDQKQIILAKARSLILKGRMASMGRLME